MVGGSRTRLLLILVILLTPSLIVGMLHTNTPVNSESFYIAQTTNWLMGWQNRKAHAVSGSAGAGTDYQIKIVVHRSTGTDSGENVFVGTNCRVDFGDIRFTDDNGTTQLDYWLEESDTSHAVFWVEVRDDLDTDQSINIYYGNSEASSASDGDSTFIFFDDFDDESIDISKWSVHGPWLETGGVASFSIAGDGGMSILPSLRTDDTWDMQNKSITSSWRVNEMTVNREWGVSCADTSADDHTRMAYFLAFNTTTTNNVRSYFDVNSATGYDHSEPIIGQYIPSTFMITEFVSTPDAITKNKWILDGEIVDIFSTYSFDMTPQYIFLGFYVFGYNNTLISGQLEMEFDYVYLRNHIGSEPSHASWGVEESPSTSSTSPSPGPYGIDSWMILMIAGGGGAVALIVLVLVFVRSNRRGGGSVQTPYEW